MKPPTPSDAFPRQVCGCPVETGRYPYRCPAHAALDGRVKLPWEGPAVQHGQWYADNCCPFCGRVNPYGLACSITEQCGLCGVKSCERHDMATYWLHVICPRGVNPRTKAGRALLKSLTMFGRGLAANVSE